MAPLATSAAVIWSIEASTSDGGPLTAVTPGAQIFVDITARSSGGVIGLSASAFGYDPDLLTLVDTTISDSIFVAFATGPGTGVGGITRNPIGPVSEEIIGGGGAVRFFEGLAPGPSFGTGEQDISPISGLAGGPQFRLVFEFTPDLSDPYDVGGSTVMTIGINDGIGDEIIDDLGRPGQSINTALEITIVPEPTTALLLTLGLTALASTRRPQQT